MNNETNRGLFFPARSSLGRNVLWIASIALLYFAVARFSLLFVFEPEGIAAIWPLSGIFLSAILLTRRDMRPWLVGALFITDFIGEMLTGTPWVVSLIYALALTGDAILSSWLLLRFVGAPITFRRVRELVSWLLFSVILSNALASLVAAAAASRFLPGTSFWSSWGEWAASDGIGNLVVTPLILSWAAWGRTRLRGWNLKRILEAAALFILLVLLNYIAFSRLSEYSLLSLLLTYLTFPFLLWAAWRFEVRGVASASLILAAIVIYFASTGRINLFNQGSPLDVVIRMQLFLAIMAAPALFLATMMTERKQVEQALRASEERYRTLYENVPIGIYRTTPDGHILMANPALVHMLGYTSFEELSGRDLAKEGYEPGYPRQHFQERIEREGGLRGLESTWKCKDGSIIHVRESAHLVRDEKNLPLFYEGTVEDITERKRAEQELKAYSEHLEEIVTERTRELREAQAQLIRQEKLAVLGQLAGGVGHELRNPLGVINSAIYYLKLVQPDADEKIKQYHAIVEQEVHTAEKIINDLLDFARLKGGEGKPVSVPELVQRVLVRFPVPPSVKVTLKLPARLPKVFADPPQMEQVLGNLVINACQAMVSPGSTTGVPQGGKLTISARRQNELVAIAVKDTGVGIPPENMNKLFEPLFTTKLKGIGLGLAVSQKLVEANSGRIEVKSEPGKGSMFTLYLPVYQS